MKYIKWLVVLLLAGLTLVLFYHNFVQDKIERKQVMVSHYDSTKAQPVILGRIEEPNNQYIHVKFNFQAISLNGYPNLFQTDPVNSGVRVEAHDSTLSIIIADSLGVAGFTLTNKLIAGRWYKFEMEAENRGFVRAWLDDRLVVNYKSLAISMPCVDVIFGKGFDNTRVFNGYISEIKFIIGNRVKSLLEPIFSGGSNYLILIVSFLLTLICLTKYRVVVKCSHFCSSVTKVSSAATVIMILLQLILILCFPSYKYVFITFVFLFFLGSSLYYLTPSFLRANYSCLVLSPIYGLAIISIVGGGLIASSLNIRTLIPIVAVFALSMHVFNFIRGYFKVESLFENIKSDVVRFIFVLTGIITPITLILVYPVLSLDFSTSTYRVGPDLASYAKMAQYLLDGGSLHDETMRLHEFANMTPGEINRYTNATMSWPLMYFFRWGLVAYQATVTVITGTKHVYETMFISMILPYFMLSGLVIIWLYRLIKLSLVFSILGGLAFLFNSNLLNLWYEGFYGNLYAMPFIVLTLLTFQYLRGEKIFWNGSLVKTILLLVVLISACLLSYPEAIVFVSGVFLVLIFAVDVLTRRAINYSAYLALLLSFLVSLLVIFPYGFLIDWAILAFKQITQEGANGYPQPFWAFPHEILGMANIYLYSSPSVAGQLLHRPIVNMALAFAVSLTTLYIVFRGVKLRWAEDNVLYMASMLMVLIFACYVYVKSPTNNYAFMKIYIFQLPLLFIAFWCCLSKFSSNLLVKSLFKGKANHQYLVCFVAMLVALNGGIYILKYASESTQITKPEIELHNQIQNLDFNNVIIYPASLQKIRYIYPAILSAPWMVPEEWDSAHWANNPYYLKYLDRKVYVFVEKDGSALCPIKDEQIVFENLNFLIMDPGIFVKQSIDFERNYIDFNRFSNLIYCNEYFYRNKGF